MSLRVLELNDFGISLSDENSVLASSPAYVVVEGERVLFGTDAAARSRLNPVDCNNRFWYALDMEPLARPLANFRHHADIAYAHLQHLAEQAGAEGDVIVAAPGSFSRAQLAVLLGVIRHSPFNALALVDASVASAVLRGGEGPMAHLDLQLHQMVLSVLETDAAGVQRTRLVQLPDLGWDQLSNTVVQLITDAFIRQCRFNPQHNAQWEQHLHNALPRWMAQEADSDDTILLEIDTGSTVHRARLPRTAIQTRLQGHYHKLLQQLSELPDTSRTLLFTQRCAGLPGFARFLKDALRAELHPDTAALDARLLSQSCLRLRDHILGDSESLHFITALPWIDADPPAATPDRPVATDDFAKSSVTAPTHLLHGDQAWPLGQGLALQQGDDLQFLSLAGADGGTRQSGRLLGKIVCRDGQFLMQAEDGSLHLNRADDSERQHLLPGDRITLHSAHDGGQSLQLIRVHNE